VALFAGWLIHLISHRRWVVPTPPSVSLTNFQFCLGVAIVSTYRSFTRNIEARSLATFSASPKRSLDRCAYCVDVFAALIMLRRQLLFATFDPKSLPPTACPPVKIDLISLPCLRLRYWPRPKFSVSPWSPPPW